MNRIQSIFKNRSKKIIPFITAGFPSMSDTINLVLAAEKSGADMVEVGMPFSDPLADGPIIQNSSNVAISNGVTINWILDVVNKVRDRSDVPIALMGYINPILKYGLEKFIKDSYNSGVDGLIIPDLPPEEAGEYLQLSRRHNICAILLVSPNTPPERIKKISILSGGLIYCVSVLGITGGKSGFSKSFNTYMARVNENSVCPHVVGFGIKDRFDVIEVNKLSHGAVIGSAIIDELSNAKDPVLSIKNFMEKLI